jgi:hypothetical protein
MSLYIFAHHIFCSFLLRQKRTKKGDPETMYSPFPEGASIELLYYCGEEHLFIDGFTIGKNYFRKNISMFLLFLCGK